MKQKPLPSLTRKSYAELKAWRHQVMRDEVNDAKALQAGQELNARVLGEDLS